jgi:hypothetical protein
MKKEVPEEPLEFSFDDSSDDNQEQVKTYTLSNINSIEETELELGEEIQSTHQPVSTFELSLEEDENDIQITSESTEIQIVEKVVDEISVESETISNEIKNIFSGSSIFDEIANSVAQLTNEQETLVTNINDTNSELQNKPISELPPTINQIHNSTNLVSKKKLPSKHLSSIITGIVVLFLFLIVLAINYFIFASEPKTDIESLSQAISSTGNKKDDEVKSIKEPVESTLIKIEKFSVEDLNGEIKLSIDKSKNTGSIQVNGFSIEPATLTIEEIGRGLKPKIWIKSLESQKYSFNFTSSLPQNLTIQTRVYFKKSEKTFRAVSTIDLEFIKNIDNYTLKVKINIPNDYKNELQKDFYITETSFNL